MTYDHFMGRNLGLKVVMILSVVALIASGVFIGLQSAQLARTENEAESLRDSLGQTESELQEALEREEDLEVLSRDNATVSAERSVLSDKHDKLESEHETLESEHETLGSEHDALESEYSRLAREYEQLQTTAQILEMARDRAEQDLSVCEEVLSSASQSGQELETAYDELRRGVLEVLENPTSPTVTGGLTHKAYRVVYDLNPASTWNC